jgi:hypothetical protein
MPDHNLSDADTIDGSLAYHGLTDDEKMIYFGYNVSLFVHGHDLIMPVSL